MKLSISFPPYSSAVTLILRILIGAVFIISGLSKAIDPWGFIYKIEEYLAVWGMEQPRSIVLVGAIGISAYEFICGLMLAIGAFRRTMPWWLMASMAVMLPLTAYIAIADPVSDCGCFGDFLKLSNPLTFIKNIVITLALIYLIRYNRTLRIVAVRPALQWIAFIASFTYILAIALLGYIVQPLVDFRSYPEGTSLVASAPQSTSGEMIFRYEKDGITEDFTIDQLPDSTWTFVSRTMPETAGTDSAGSFTVYDEDEDVTADVIPDEGLLLLITLPDPDLIDIAYAYNANVLAQAVADRGGSTVGLLAAGSEGIDDWIDMSMAQYPCYTVDDTTLKTLVRGTIGAVLIDNGVIKWKRALSSVDYLKLESLADPATSLDSIAVDSSLLPKLTGVLVAILLLLAAISHLFGPHNLLFKKKDVNLHHESDNKTDN